MVTIFIFDGVTLQTSNWVPLNNIGGESKKESIQHTGK